MTHLRMLEMVNTLQLENTKEFSYAALGELFGWKEANELVEFVLGNNGKVTISQQTSQAVN